MNRDNSLKNLFDVALANQVKQRIDSLRNDSERQWGKMSVAQAIAHCVFGLQMALGEIRPPRALMGDSATRERTPPGRNLWVRTAIRWMKRTTR